MPLLSKIRRFYLRVKRMVVCGQSWRHVREDEEKFLLFIRKKNAEHGIK